MGSFVSCGASISKDKVEEVLFEKAPRGKAMHGFTRNYIRVELPPSEAREEYDNQLMTVRLGDFNYKQNALRGTIMDNR